MSTLRFNFVGATCGLLSTFGASLTCQGHAVAGVSLSLTAASASVLACVSWFRARALRSAALRI
jgi:hypothetical protein